MAYHDHATVIKNGIHRICMYRDGPDMGACVCVTVRVLLVVCVEIWGYRERMAKNE